MRNAWTVGGMVVGVLGIDSHWCLPESGAHLVARFAVCWTVMRRIVLTLVCVTQAGYDGWRGTRAECWMLSRIITLDHARIC